MTTYSEGISEFIADFVAKRGDIEAKEPGAWAEEFSRLSHRDRDFFSTGRFIFGASKPLRPASNDNHVAGLLAAVRRRG
jgi:hypothetical protein